MVVIMQCVFVKTIINNKVDDSAAERVDTSSRPGNGRIRRFFGGNVMRGLGRRLRSLAVSTMTVVALTGATSWISSAAAEDFVSRLNFYNLIRYSFIIILLMPFQLFLFHR